MQTKNILEHVVSNKAVTEEEQNGFGAQILSDHQKSLSPETTDAVQRLSVIETLA